MKREEKVLAVQRMQDYIENHMTETITLKVLSDCAGYSPFHCSRIFKELTGKAPFDYIRIWHKQPDRRRIFAVAAGCNAKSP